MKFLKALSGVDELNSASASKALSKIEAELGEMPARVRAAQDALADLADLTDEQHAAADSELASLRRAEARLKAQAVKAREARDRALKEEAAVALRARRETVARRVASYARLNARYEQKATELQGIVEEMKSVEDDADALNRELLAAKRAEPDRSFPALIATPQELHRIEPDVVEPDRTIVDEKVMQFDRGLDRWVEVGLKVTQRVGSDDRVVLQAGQTLRKVEKVIPGRTRVGKRICSPTSELVLPAARVAQKNFWPREA